MKNIFFCLIYLLTSLFSHTGLHSQNLSPEVQREVDSLSREIKSAKHDTIKIKLRYKIGVKKLISRFGYWDSLILDANQSGFKRFESKALNALGHFYNISEQTEKAIDCFERSYKLAVNAGDQELLTTVLYNISSHFTNKHETKKAINYCFRGLKSAEASKNERMIANFYFMAALSYFSSGQINEALKLHFKCLKIYEKLKDDDGTLGCLIAIGADYQALKKQSTTIIYYLKAKKYLHGVISEGTAINANNSVGAAYTMLKLYDSAHKYANIALDIAKKINHTQSIVSIKASIAKAYLHEGNIRAAKQTAIESSKLLETISFPLQIPELNEILRQIYVKEGNYKEALRCYEVGVKIKDSLQSADIKKQTLETEFNYNLEKKESANKLLAQQNQIQNLQLGQSRYFIFGLGAVALLILVIAYLIVRQNKLNNQHQKMYLEQKLISSQMNPHFVFNSLNAIQHLIMTKQNDKAEIYLSKFANLIRELLESNTKESLTLKEEVGILNGFLEMESRRFGKSFNYHVIVEEGIDTDKINIPHMLVQPFIENAIWHGLLAKEGERNLAVTFTRNTDKTIQCVVQDNGIGREASQKKQSTFKKKSLALSFVKQRMELLSETLKIKCSVEIVDMVGERGEALGTKVNVVLPIMT